ncbi:hypothetical protein C8R44DRAFT_884900 [Mycena epipterygia]|nr:hypothetical protein C8R44DRAFT_884900 [Mycena epipterygia]
MTFCPSFSSLQTNILVSRAFYRVFQMHPKLITWALASTTVGPALPQALRVILFPYPAQGMLLDPAACPEDTIPTTITSLEQARLEKNSRVAARLENIYFVLHSHGFIFHCTIQERGSHLKDILYVGYFVHALESVWTACGVPLPMDDADINTAILDSVYGVNDTCARCSAPGGLKLLTEANWTRLVLNSKHLFKGRLAENLVLGLLFYSHPAIARMWPSQLFGSMARIVGWGENEGGDETDYEHPDVAAAAWVIDHFITRLFADEIWGVLGREVDF